MKCLYCIINNKKTAEINKNSLDYYMIPVEVPYTNLFFHTDCLSKIDNILIFLTENIKIWYNNSVQR